LQGSRDQRGGASPVGTDTGARIRCVPDHRYTFRRERGHADAIAKRAVVPVAAIMLNGLVPFLATFAPGLQWLTDRLLATPGALPAAPAANRASPL
jgi:hypothetical protein